MKKRTFAYACVSETRPASIIFRHGTDDFHTLLAHCTARRTMQKQRHCHLYYITFSQMKQLVSGAKQEVKI